MTWRAGRGWWRADPHGPDAVASSQRPVVTVWGRYGTFSSEVAQRVADRLRVPFHDETFPERDILEVMADESSPQTELGAFVRSLLAAGDAPNLSDADDHPPRPALADLHRVPPPSGVDENTRHVRRYAENGGVIVGHSATRILAGRPGALHVKLSAPYSHRISQVEQRTGLSADEVRERARLDEWLRSRTSIVGYGWDPRFDDLFGLVLNTALWDADTTIEIIAAAAHVAANRG